MSARLGSSSEFGDGSALLLAVSSVEQALSRTTMATINVMAIVDTDGVSDASCRLNVKPFRFLIVGLLFSGQVRTWRAMTMRLIWLVPS